MAEAKTIEISPAALKSVKALQAEIKKNNGHDLDLSDVIGRSCETTRAQLVRFSAPR
jgi:hypothetical protein